MINKKEQSDAVQEYKLMPQDGSFLEGEWFYEENMKALRIGLRVREKLHEETSRFQKIAVFDTAFFGRVLIVDGSIMLTERDEFIYHEMISHVPLCSIPEPRSVLIVGGGDCGSLREVLKHPAVEQVIQVEIDERVTRVCEEFFPWVRPSLDDKRVKLVFDDGIEYVNNVSSSFDLVMIDSTDPVGPGLGLFVRAFYNDVAKILKPMGVLVAQTESPYCEPVSVKRIYQELRGSFKHVSAYCGTVPTYPGGHWTWCYASPERKPDDFFDRERATLLETTCLYFNAGIQKAAFQLPNYTAKVISGHNPFLRFDRDHLEAARKGFF